MKKELKKELTAYAAVFFLALVIRISLLIAVNPGISPTGDEKDYYAIALNIINGHGYSLNGIDPTATRMPGFPFFIAGIMSVSNLSTGWVRIVQCIVDSFTCVLIFLTGNLLFRRFSYGLTGGLISALYFPMAARSITLLSETLFTFFFIASVFSLMLYLSRRKERYLFVSGILLGIGGLIRPNGVLVMVFFSLWLFYKKPAFRSIKKIVFFILGFAVIFSPWVIRNYVVFGRLIPTFTLSGITLYNSYFIPHKGFSFNEIMPEHERIYNSLNGECEKNDYLKNTTVNFIKENPLYAAKLIPLKLSLLVYPFDMKWMWDKFPFRFNIFWGMISILTVFSVIKRYFSKIKNISLFWFIIAGLIITSAITYGSPRMRGPFDPLFIMGSVAGIFGMLKEKKYSLLYGIVVLNVILIFAGEFFL